MTADARNYYTSWQTYIQAGTLLVKVNKGSCVMLGFNVNTSGNHQ